MKVKELYENISKQGIEKIKNNEEFIDKYLDDPNDTRFGLTLIIKQPKEIMDKIEYVENEIKKVEPEEYYYPQSDYHITLLEMIQARAGFKYTKEQVENSMNAIEDAIKNSKKFKIRFKGIICSNGAVIVKGFYDEEMEKIRQNLRKALPQHNMKVDERYPTISGHITIVRFRKTLENREAFLNKVQEYKEFDFGEYEVSELQLICHNCFDSKKEILKKYTLD